MQDCRLVQAFRFVCLAALCVVGSGFCGFAVAQDAELSEWQRWYSNYQNNSYVIELTATTENAEKLQQRINVFRRFLLYLPAPSSGNNSDLVVKVGFFKSRQQAQEFLDVSKFLFKDQTVQRISVTEHGQVLSALAEDDLNNTAYVVFPISKNADSANARDSEKLLDAAKSQYIAGHYQQALGYYHLLVAVADERSAAWAQELSGLCYEKLNQRDKAEAAYTSLISNYPESEGLARVEQRLRALQTANDDGKQALAQSKYANSSDHRTFVRGDVSQYHRSLTRSINNGDATEVVSALSTDVDLRASFSNGDHSIKARLNGFSIQDQLDGEDNETRIKRAYVDYRHEGIGINATLGRQKNFDSGVFTSFDGATLSYPIQPAIQLSASLGRPVYFADVYDNLDYFFYSLFADWEVNQHWQLTTYLVNQTLNDVTDREAVGLRANYFSDRFSSSLNIDYDQAFGELNNLLFNSNYMIRENLGITALYGQQRAPFLSAANILIGQADLDLDLYLQSQINEDTLLDDALARTSINTYYSLALNYKIAGMGRVIVDYYQSDLTDIPTQEILTGIPSSQPAITEFSQQTLGAQLVIENAFMPNDSASLGIRSTDGDSSSSVLIFLNDRVRFGNKFFINPKISYSQISFEARREDQDQLRYSLSVGYKPFRNTELNLEWGNESISVTGGSDDFQSNYLFIGYRVHF